MPGPRRAAVALIDEARCIGCARCIDACPFDAIVGASGLMHTVVASWCSGCELCLPPCPVDCIALVPATNWAESEAHAAIQRVRRRKRRLAQRAIGATADVANRRAILAAALQRARRA